MASYSVLLKPSVEKDLRALPKSTVKRLWTRIESLAVDPLPTASIKLGGAEALHRIRVGDYRVVYTVDHQASQVIIHYVRHRKDAYRGL
jgi:mRNA interferase RelE/StbE